MEVVFSQHARSPQIGNHAFKDCLSILFLQSVQNLLELIAGKRFVVGNPLSDFFVGRKMTYWNVD